MAKPGVALASGMGAIHAALASQLRAGDRIVAPNAVYGSTRTQLVDTFVRFGVRVDFADLTDTSAAAAVIAEAPTRVVYAETIANPTTFVTDHGPSLAWLTSMARRTSPTTRSPPRTYAGRSSSGRTSSSSRRTKFLSGHSDVIAGVVAGPLDLIRKVEKVQVDTGATVGPFDAFLVLRGILTLAVRAERHARTAAALAAWLERQDGVQRVLYPASRATPSTMWPSASFGAGSRAACWRSRSRAAGTRAARSSTR